MSSPCVIGDFHRACKLFHTKEKAEVLKLMFPFGLLPFPCNNQIHKDLKGLFIPVLVSTFGRKSVQMFCRKCSGKDDVMAGSANTSSMAPSWWKIRSFWLICDSSCDTASCVAKSFIITSSD